MARVRPTDDPSDEMTKERKVKHVKTGLLRSAGVALAIGLATVGSAGAMAADKPGKGVTVQPARATWNTGYFQAEIYIRALRELGYTVKKPKELKNEIFYQAVAQGDVDFWVNGWFPLHNDKKKIIAGKASIVGYVAKGGALQGYLVDKKTADRLNIKSLEDFKRKEVKKAFDSNGDGKADLVACPPGWGCEQVIKHQLNAYDLRDHINPVKAEYSASMAAAVGRFKSGKSIFFYTWTPNWTVGILKPGKDVVWIGVPFPSLPKGQEKFEKATTVAGVAGCVSDPCKMGWPANDLRPVVNNKFMEKNPAAKRLFEVVSIPLGDIFEQNAKMQNGENKQSDIERHAEAWVAKNRKLFDGWLAEARKAAK
jgi:glycine betaine/proline transport system substrate-binding protein